MKKPGIILATLMMITLVPLLAACGNDPIAIAPGGASTPTASPTTTSTTVAPDDTATPVPLLATNTPQPTVVPATVTPAAPTDTAEPTDTTAPTDTAEPTDTTAPTAKPTTKPASTTVATTPTSQPDAQGIRATDWKAAYATTLKNNDQQNCGPEDPQTAQSDGYWGEGPTVEQVAYVDMDGDGVEEAAVPIASGGTAGNTWVFIYKYSDNKVVLADCLNGYKMYPQNVDGKLVVGEPIYQAWEANCCASGEEYTTYVFKKGKLAKTATTNTGDPKAHPSVVEAFYTMLSGKNYADAYKLLSPAYQKTNPYNKWQTGYANTESLEVTATDADQKAGTVHIELKAVDNGSKGKTTHTFSGTWTVKWITSTESWQLSDPNIKETTSSTAPTKGAANSLDLYQPILADLKAQTKIPILLPTVFGSNVTQKLYPILSDTNDTEYTVNLNFTPDCVGHACYYGQVFGLTDDGTNSKNILTGDTTVDLTNDITGYFTDYSCGASCSDSRLAWESDDGYMYVLSINSGLQDDMVKMANAMITLGPLN